MRRRTLLTEDKKKYLNKYLTFIPLEDGTFSFLGGDTSTGDKYKIKYSIDGGETWSDLTGDSPTVESRNEIMFKADYNQIDSDTSEEYATAIGRFRSTCRFNVEGNIMSLIYGDEFIGKKSLEVLGSKFNFYNLFANTRVVDASNLMLSHITLIEACFYNMFVNCTSLTEAPELSATELAMGCYAAMFYSCTSLIEAPELPATELAMGCYSEMFYECTSLTETPELPATTLAYGCYIDMFCCCSNLTTISNLPATTLAERCYAYMFDSCDSLTEAPELPATELAISCYEAMFKNCTRLTEAPELPATTLADECYMDMFGNCYSLTEAPELPATTLADSCYKSMFYNCTNLTEAPELLATELTRSCYETMFYGCSNLSKVKCLATQYSSANNSTGNWLVSVSQTGTFTKAASAVWPYDSTGIPEGWTIINV